MLAMNHSILTNSLSSTLFKLKVRREWEREREGYREGGREGGRVREIMGDEGVGKRELSLSLCCLYIFFQ
jgi:hypothetical protein